MGEKHHRLRGRSNGLVAYICMPLALAGAGLVIAGLALGTVETQAKGELASLFHSGESYRNEQLAPVLGDAQENTEPEEESGERIEVKEPNIGEQYGRMVCDRLGMDVPLYFGDNDGVLDLGIGTYPASWIPGCGRTALMAGHARTFCAPLENVAYGDEFKISTEYGDFVYQVADFKIVQETDVAACKLEELKDQIVLYTCYPFYATWHVPERFFVYLEKVSGPEITLLDYYMKDEPQFPEESSDSGGNGITG